MASAGGGSLLLIHCLLLLPLFVGVLWLVPCLIDSVLSTQIDAGHRLGVLCLVLDLLCSAWLVSFIVLQSSELAALLKFVFLMSCDC